MTFQPGDLVRCRGHEWAVMEYLHAGRFSLLGLGLSRNRDCRRCGDVVIVAAEVLRTYDGGQKFRVARETPVERAALVRDNIPALVRQLEMT
jgi:hypothetical protein